MAFILGADTAAAALAAHIKAAFPPALAAVRAANNWDGGTLPDPVIITSADMPEIPIESWPALEVLAERTLGQRAAGVDAAGRPVWEVTYRMAVEGYVRAQGFEATSALVRRYAAILRGVIVDRPTLRVDGFGDAYPRVDVATIAEEYTPTFGPPQGRTLASFRTTLDLRQYEPAPGYTASATGEFATAHVTTEVVGPAVPLPRHPAL